MNSHHSLTQTAQKLNVNSCGSKKWRNAMEAPKNQACSTKWTLAIDRQATTQQLSKKRQHSRILLKFCLSQYPKLPHHSLKDPKLKIWLSNHRYRTPNNEKSWCNKQWVRLNHMLFARALKQFRAILLWMERGKIYRILLESLNSRFSNQCLSRCLYLATSLQRPQA